MKYMLNTLGPKVDIPDIHFLSPARRSGGWGVLASPRMSVHLPSVRPASGCPHFVSGAELGNPCMDFFLCPEDEMYF